MPAREVCADVSLELNRHVVNLLDSLSALSGLTTIPIRDLDEPTLLKRALEALMENQDMERCSIFLLGDDGCLTNAAGRDWDDMLDDIARHEPAPDRSARATTRFRLGEGLIGRAAATRAIEHCRSCKEDVRFEQLAGASVDGSLLCVPIACEEGVLGVLNVYHPAAGFFNLWHERLLLLFCQVLGRLLLHHRFTHRLGMLVARKTEELEHQRHFLQTVLDSAPDPMMVIGTDYRVLLTNRPEAAEQAGLPRYCYGVTHRRDRPCDSAAHPCPLRTVIGTGLPATVVHEHFDDDGRPRIVELLAAPLHDPAGRIVGIVESARDITERTRVADALQKSEERLKAAERIAQFGSWELDLVAGKLTWSEEAFRIFEVDPGRFGASYEAFLQAVHPEDRERVNIAFRAAVKNRLLYDITHRLLLPDGGIKYVRESGQTFYATDGTPLRAAGAVQDVTLAVLNEEAIRESEERFRTIADYTYDWEYWRGPGREFLYISPSCQRITGYSQAEFIGRPQLMDEIVHPDDRPLLAKHVQDVGEHDACQIEYRIVAKDGDVHWISHACRAVYGRDGRPMGRRGSNRDITAQKLAELEYKTIVQTAQDGFLVVDAATRFLDTNEACCRMLGYSREELLGMKTADIEARESPADIDRHMAAIRSQGVAQFETRHRRKDGRVIDVDIHATLLDVRGGVLIVFIRDITERKKADARIRQLAYFDPLTGLPNRRMLLDRLDQALSQARRHRRPLAVMFMDLDHFKQINDTLGHDVGDELLKEVATRLDRCVRAGDTVSRQGGDEFVIVLAEIADPRDAALVAEKILQSFAEPIPAADEMLNVTTSIGIAVFPVGGGDRVHDLLKKADMAMYEAKAGGRNGYRFHAPPQGTP